MTPEEANEIISEYMDKRKVPLFAASDDTGMSARFTNESRAVVQHFLDDDPNGYHKEYRVVNWSYWHYYSESLDALVPVWEKLSIYGVWININRHGLDHYQVAFVDKQSLDIEENNNFHAVSENIKEAAAIATAKAIKDLAK